MSRIGIGILLLPKSLPFPTLQWGGIARKQNHSLWLEEMQYKLLTKTTFGSHAKKGGYTKWPYMALYQPNTEPWMQRIKPLLNFNK